MKKLALGLPLLMVAPLLLLVLGMGNANIEAVQAACATTSTSSTGGMFGIGTLNWRGASHYEKNPHPGERPYGVRVPNMVAKVGASGASIIGFQEFEPPQAEAFLRATHGAWAIVKGRAGGKPATANSIAYQPGVWTVDEVRYVAIKYGGPDVILVSAQLEDGSASGRAVAVEAAIVRVTDHGPGISDSDFAAIWEPFVRGRRGQGRSQGNGLGLAVVRLLADSVGWEVGVASAAGNGTAGPGSGATFFVRFPLVPPDATQASEVGRSG